MRMALSQEFYDKLDEAGALSGEVSWKAIQVHIREKLQLSTFNLKMGLHRDP